MNTILKLSAELSEKLGIKSAEDLIAQFGDARTGYEGS